MEILFMQPDTIIYFKGGSFEESQWYVGHYVKQNTNFKTAGSLVKIGTFINISA
jgi:hypothetical protein